MAQVLILDSLDDTFICGLCKSNYNSLHLFLEHKRLCERAFADNTDLSTVKSKEELNLDCNDEVRHKGASSTQTLLTGEECSSTPTCTVCQKTFSKIKSLTAHMKAHEEKPYQCPICGRCFAHNSYLQRHITTHKIWPDTNNEIITNTCDKELLNYECQYCDTVMSNYVLFRSHMKIHQALKKFRCIQGECMEYFKTLEEVVHHVASTHTPPTYTCHICAVSFRTLEEIARHHKFQKHHDVLEPSQNKQFKCALCDAVFKKFEKLSLHMLTENHKKVCIHCNKSFTSNKRLRLHLQVHRQLKPYQCTICKSAFRMKKYLSTHMLKHGKSQFKCAVCKAMFKRQDLLQRHMKLHQTKNKYKCPFRDTLDCKKEFTRSDKLKAHIKVHTKHTYYPPSRTKMGRELDTGTIEICIVPLDSKKNDN